VFSLVCTGAAAALAAVWAFRRVVVHGRSMAPTLLPGDRLVVVRVPRWWPLRPGVLVAARDPRRPDRLLVKRALPAGADTLELVGDNPGGSTDSRTFGPVPRRAVVGVAWYRYAPAARAGRLPRPARGEALLGPAEVAAGAPGQVSPAGG
jgi:nickel-type superoxide dismutase maturation protease